VPYGDMTLPPLFSTIVKDDSKVLVVGTNIDVGDSTLIQLETITALTSIVPSASTAPKDEGLEGKVEIVNVIEVTVMEEYCR
jgi:hypothetical protein